MNGLYSSSSVAHVSATTGTKAKTFKGGIVDKFLTKLNNLFKKIFTKANLIRLWKLCTMAVKDCTILFLIVFAFYCIGFALPQVKESLPNFYESLDTLFKSWDSLIGMISGKI